MKRVVFTGGGTAGHITPNFAVIQRLKPLGIDVHYIGMKNSMEATLVLEQGIPFYGISGGKLRRYLDIKNLMDLFRITLGFFQSIILMLQLRPQLIFSKGGFVACPVVWAAWLCRIPVVIHESDLTPGLANKLCVPFAKKICYAFTETKPYLPEEKRIHTGLPIRDELSRGDFERGLHLTGFNREKPIVLITGGSQGAASINRLVRDQLESLLEGYQICHIAGKGNIDASLTGRDGYAQFAFVTHQMPDLMAIADIVISRAGATTLFELLALKKLNILMPLSAKVSRGDQILNAASFEKAGFSKVLSEDGPVDLAGEIQQVLVNRKAYESHMADSKNKATDAVIQIILGILN